MPRRASSITWTSSSTMSLIFSAISGRTRSTRSSFSGVTMIKSAVRSKKSSNSSVS